MNYNNRLELNTCKKEGTGSAASPGGTKDAAQHKNAVFRKLLVLQSGIDDLEIRVKALELAQELGSKSNRKDQLYC